MIPIVPPSRSPTGTWARSAQRPFRTRSVNGPNRLTRCRASPRTPSATARVPLPGVMTTGIPLALAAARSTRSTPTPVRARTRSRGARSSRAASTTASARTMAPTATVRSSASGSGTNITSSPRMSVTNAGSTEPRATTTGRSAVTTSPAGWGASPAHHRCRSWSSSSLASPVSILSTRPDCWKRSTRPSRLRQLGDERGGQQRRVRANRDEGPALLVPFRCGGAVRDQEATPSSESLSGRANPVQRGEIAWRLHVAWDSQVVAEITGADEQDIDPVQRSDLLHVLHGPGRLDLHQSENLCVGAVEGSGIQAEATSPVVRRHPSIAVWGIAEMPQRLADLDSGVLPRQHDPRRAEIKNPAETDPGRGLCPDHGGDLVGCGGNDNCADLLLTAGTMLEIQQHPVHAGRSTHLRRDCRGHPNHRWEVRPASYSARSWAIASCSNTSAGATSHQAPAGGRSACGIAGITRTTGPSWSLVPASAPRTSAAVVARIARAPRPRAISRRSTRR